MTFSQAVTTLIGAFLFPLLIRLLWGSIVKKFGPIGGWMAAFLIVGGAWALNHSSSRAFIHQSGSVWVDMGLAAAVGIFVATAVKGGNSKKALGTVFSGIVGGFISGAILFLVN